MRGNDLIISVLLLFWAAVLPARAWQGNNSSKTDPSGHTTTSIYDSSGKLVSVTDWMGNTSHVGADQAGRIPSGKADTKSTGAMLSPRLAATIHVPADQSTIQAAIDAAVNGDTVLVADGTYKENINFEGKAITVTSVNGPAVTTIDGGGIDTVVTFRTNETAGSVLNGFTITGGFSQVTSPSGNLGEGGGVYISFGSPTIANNLITNNQACEGDGIFVYFGSPLIQGNAITSNAQSGCSGGTEGGGIFVLGAPIPSASTAQILGNLIANNTNFFAGSGIALNAAGTPLIQDNIISGNNGTEFGGGISMLNGSSPRIVQNLIIYNQASQGGGVYWLIPANPPGILLLNNTIAGNSATQGSGVYADGFDSNAQLANNIIVGTGGINAVVCGSFGSTIPSTFIANDAFTVAGTAYGGICDPTGTNGNISADPLFVNPAADNFHLLPSSPAIDAGSTAFPQIPSTDLDGNNRFINTKVDMGAYESVFANIAAIQTSLTVHAGQSGTLPLNISSRGTLGTSVMFACSGLPTGAQCLFHPASVAPASLPTTVMLTLTTTGLKILGSSSITQPRRGRIPWYSFGMVLPVGVLLGEMRRRRKWSKWLPLGITVLLLGMALQGCGGGSGAFTNVTTVTAPGTYSVVVNAVSGATQNAISISLTVQP